MAQIFLSHSAGDNDLVDLFTRCVAGTNVRLVCEEFERIVRGEVSAGQIKADILASNAIFIVLSTNVQNIPHTRDWVLSESSAAVNKDIWVFEQVSDLGRISVVTPFLKHYVMYESSDDHFRYLRAIVESYDDSHVLGTVAIATGVGSVLGKGPGAAVGALAGLALSDRSKIRPMGSEIRCAICASIYNLHLPEGLSRFRCPVCNSWLGFQSFS